MTTSPGLEESRCFNPCCGGSDPSTALPRAGRRHDLRVSILVAVDRTRQPPEVLEPTPEEQEVSILVAVDRTRQRAEQVTVWVLMVWFQSLLRWIGPVNVTLQAIGRILG